MKKKCCLPFLSIITCCVFAVFPNISDAALKEHLQETEEHDVTVTLKLVQVYVTDKEGNPVTDLKQDDFEIIDKGKKKTITDFEKHVLTAPVVETVKTGTVGEKAEPADTPKRNRRFYIFFDFAFNTSRGILDSKKAALHFIDDYLQSTDELGLFSFSAGEGLVLHEILTTDHDKVREIIEGFGIRRILGRAENLERKYWRQVMELDELSKQGADPFIMEIKQQEKEVLKTERIEFQFQISAFIQTMKNLAKALRYVKGHKHIIMFSSGVPRVVFEGAIVNTTSSSRQNTRFEEGMFGRGKLRREYEIMNKELASSSCAIHTVYSIGDVPGLNVEVETDYAIKDGGYMDRQLSGIAPLQWISEASGGKHFGNIKKYDSIMKEIQSFTGSYYILGYYIDEKRDGKYRKLKVKVKRKGCEVFAQDGYYNPKPFSQYSKLEKQYQFLELALIENPEFQAPLTLPSEAFSCEVDGYSSLLMLSKIPAENFDKLAGKKVEIVNLVFNEENDVVSVKRVESDLSGLQGGDMFNYCIFYLPPGKYRGRLVIRNLESGSTAVASSSAVIPDEREEGIRLYPPLLIVPKKDAKYINTRGIKRDVGEREYSALSNIYPFDASKFSPLLGELERGSPELYVLAPGVVLGTQHGTVKFYTRLVYEPTWKEIPKKVIANKMGGVFTFKLQTGDLIPGRYYLYLFAEDQDTQARANVNTTFVIK